ncbi:MAG: peptidoglycan -binding protein [Alphaproteobacteria bacterium]|nr:peptidoglycan -binding protein [Alphaproteobacteria bacterium]MCA0449761.1 peptidoglycan -binding protein [Pseudomonadota bacterium]
MRGSGRRTTRTVDVWPGFVDALATLVIAIVFVVMVFTVFQFHLKDIIAGRDDQLSRASAQLAQLAETLALEKRATDDLRSRLQSLQNELSASLGERDNLRSLSRAQAEQIELANQSMAADREKIEMQLRELEALAAMREALEKRTASAEAQSTEDKRLSSEAQAQVALLNRQTAELREQLRRLEALLSDSERKSSEQQAQIVDLGRRLNLALASRVDELVRFRSEFYGRLRAVLGDRADMRVVGDRFVFQSEILFAPGSATIESEGGRQLMQLGNVIKEIAPRIPKEVDWVVQITGHTDRRPISTRDFPSNWELSTARSISVVRLLMANGVPSDRLQAAGMAEFQPIDDRDDEVGWRRNRRIEIRFTNR